MNNGSFDIQIILDSAGIVQGIVFGIMLFVVNKWRENSSYLLGIFLILFSLQRIPYLLSELNIFESYPEFLLLPTFALWVLSPIFFLYTKRVSVFSSKKFTHWILLPGIIHYVIQLIIFFLPFEKKLIIIEQFWLDYLKILGLIYGSFIVIWNLNFIQKHKLEVRNQYAMTRHKELSWARSFLIFYISGTILYGIQLYLVPSNLYSKLYFLLFDLVLIYWLSFQGVVQLNIHSILSNQEIIKTGFEDKTNKRRQTLSENVNLTDLFQQIHDYMNATEIYVDEELTIVDVSQKLGIHPRRVSTAINTVSKQNFNSFVNELRINKVIKLLDTRDVQNLSIEGIGNKVGFRSKSAFYSAFKKFTGTTPTKYKRVN